MKISTLVLFAAFLLPVSAGAQLAGLPGQGTVGERGQAELAAIVKALSAAHQAKVGEQAPGFTLDALVSTQDGKEFKKISLSDYRGKWLVLFFYPMDFTFVCPTEIRGFNEALDSFRKLNAEVLAASTDSKYAHLAWAQRGDLGTLKFPVLSDIRKEAAANYGCLDEKEGVALRALYIIDPQGVLQYQVVHNLEVGRSVEETLRVLEALQTGGLCPLGWKHGEKTLGK